MTPEEKARRIIDEKLCQAGWVIQDMNLPEPCCVFRCCCERIPYEYWRGRLCIVY